MSPLECEIKWITDNVDKYDSELHANSVIQNIIKRYKIKEYKTTMNENYYYHVIKKHYEGKVSKRSNIKYIDHIDEGLQILEALGSNWVTKNAFCVHPILQIPSSLKEVDVMSWNPRVVLLAMEYRNKANYFSTHMGSKPPKLILPEVTQMLIADKIQNYKSFIEHRVKYENDNEINSYFVKWLSHLGCSQYTYMLLNKRPFDYILERLKKDEELKFISSY